MKAYVFDANALVILFENKAGAEKVQKILNQANEGHAELYMSAVNAAEVCSALWKRHGEAYARKGIQLILSSPITVLEISIATAIEAAEIRAKCHTGLGDSFAASATIAKHATLVTADSGFRGLESRFKILWLPSHKSVH